MSPIGESDSSKGVWWVLLALLYTLRETRVPFTTAVVPKVAFTGFDAAHIAKRRGTIGLEIMVVDVAVVGIAFVLIAAVVANAVVFDL